MQTLNLNATLLHVLRCTPSTRFIYGTATNNFELHTRAQIALAIVYGSQYSGSQSWQILTVPTPLNLGYGCPTICQIIGHSYPPM